MNKANDGDLLATVFELRKHLQAAERQLSDSLNLDKKCDEVAIESLLSLIRDALRRTRFIKPEPRPVDLFAILLDTIPAGANASVSLKLVADKRGLLVTASSSPSTNAILTSFTGLDGLLLEASERGSTIAKQALATRTNFADGPQVNAM